MKNAIKEYIEYSDQEKKELWNNATFVFDTNVFLNLYRYSNKTRNQLMDSFDQLNSRIWMPYQVALELCKERYKVIDESNRRFETIEQEAKKLIDNWREKLRLESNDPDIDELTKYLEEWITKKNTENYKVFDVLNDEVFNRILDLFDGKTGNEFSAEKLIAIEQEGEKRYTQKIPPGYKDIKKEENKYGDLFIWKEIINYAKEQSTDIIFVTHDQKEDWWNICCGKTIGPRIELRKEFNIATGHKFHMYTMSSFLMLFDNDKARTVDKETIDEVNSFSFTKKKIVTWDEYTDYFEYLGETEKNEIKRLKMKIDNLEAKNIKREKSINSLIQKVRKKALSNQEEIALKRNRQNYKEDTGLILQYQERILKLIQDSL